MEGPARPRVCLGMPLYNQTKFLHEALCSLLGQTYTDFRLMIVDDSTDSGPGEIVQRFASHDSRITYIKNPVRRGLVDNWRTCFDYAGDMDYFGWVSDHDFWERRWLEEMVRALDAHPNVVLVYPRTGYLTSDGRKRHKKRGLSFSTQGLTEFGRVRAVCKEAGYYGKMVYGLFRAKALRRAGVFRRLLFPDVVLMLELCLLGDFKQVDEELWHMRRVADFSIARQKGSVFVRRPWYILLPWPLVNALALCWNTAIRPDSRDARHRVLGLYVGFMYLKRWLSRWGEGSWIGSYHEWRHRKKPWIRRLKTSLREKRKATTKDSKNSRETEEISSHDFDQESNAR
jgi:glycosyltransferase involved in cell wall biosynthesis